jgi:hypothetical protein
MSAPSPAARAPPTNIPIQGVTPRSNSSAAV